MRNKIPAHIRANRQLQKNAVALVRLLDNARKMANRIGREAPHIQKYPEAGTANHIAQKLGELMTAAQALVTR